jgi:hypothetical protein
MLPGHVFLLQTAICTGEPSQCFPLKDGLGCVHVLDLIITPLPQVSLHEPKLPQLLHPPSTTEHSSLIWFNF